MRKSTPKKPALLVGFGKKVERPFSEKKNSRFGGGLKERDGKRGTGEAEAGFLGGGKIRYGGRKRGEIIGLLIEKESRRGDPEMEEGGGKKWGREERPCSGSKPQVQKAREGGGGREGP